MIRNKIKIILETLFIFCLVSYLSFFVLTFFSDFMAAVMAYQKIGVFKFSMSWNLVIENAKLAWIGFPIGILLSAVRFYEIREYLLH